MTDMFPPLNCRSQLNNSIRIKVYFMTIMSLFILTETGAADQSETTTFPGEAERNVTDDVAEESVNFSPLSSNPFVDHVRYVGDDFRYPAVPDGRLTPLHLMGFGAIDIVAGWSSAGIVPAIQMAVDDVNARDDVLPGYELVLDMKDSMCDAGKAVQSLYEHLRSPPTKIMILGGGCSVATVPVARSAALYGLNQMAYSAASPELSRRDFYPSFFRTAMSDFAMNPPIIALCVQYNWDHVATIHESDPLFSTTINQIHVYFVEANITLVTAESFSTNPAGPLQNIKRKNARIIFFDAYEPAAAKAFCEIYKLGMYGPRYQWIIPGWWNDLWWTLYADDTSCTIEEIATALNYSITVTDLKGDLSGKKTVSEQTYEEYFERYTTWPSLSKYGFNAYHSFGYDAVWAAALSLNKTANTLREKDIGMLDVNGTGVYRQKGLEDFEYGVDMDISAELFKNLAEVSFHGVSGPVSFKHGERSGVSDVRQMRGVEHVRFAVFDDTIKELQWLEKIAWHSGRPPIAWPDTKILVKYKDYNLVLGASGLAAIGILLSCIVLAFNGIHREHLHIKMSSPKLNNIIVVGSIMAYLSVVSFGLDTNFLSSKVMVGVCTGRVWILSCSFTLSFGAMFAKTWRVHRIFTKLAIVNEPVHDRHLLGFVTVLLMIDLAILIPWLVIDPIDLVYQNSSIVESDDTIRIFQNEKCTCQYIWYWMAAIYLVKGLLLVFGCFLAYETRKVSIPGLNDSKFIGVCVYNVVVMCLVGVTISLVLTERETIAYSFQAFCILFCTTATLCVLFIPKAIFVRKHPEQSAEGRRRTGKSYKGGNSSSGSSTFQYSMKSTYKSTDTLNTISVDGRQIGPDLSGVVAERDKEILGLKAKLKELEQTCEAQNSTDASDAPHRQLEHHVRQSEWAEAMSVLGGLAEGDAFIRYIRAAVASDLGDDHRSSRIHANDQSNV